MGFSHRAGWFRGEYVCCLSAAVVGAFKNEMKGAMMIKPYNRPAGEGKQANLAAGVEMHPFCRLRRRLPRRGRFALRSAFVLISILRHNAAKTSPSGVAKELDS